MALAFQSDARAQEIAARATKGTLTLDASLKQPRYMTENDNHAMPVRYPSFC